MQDLKQFLLHCSKNLTTNDIFENDMSDYNYFYSFIKKHYSLEHIKQHNYLKYVNMTIATNILSFHLKVLVNTFHY